MVHALEHQKKILNGRKIRKLRRLMLLMLKVVKVLLLKRSD
jgi:hypothetical protein